MKKEPIYTLSILSFTFTNDGKIITKKDKDEKIDTLPQLFMGYSERDSKINYEESHWVINHIDDYKEKIATFFAYNSSAKQGIIKGFLIGNSNTLIDVGQLHDSIAPYQIMEMKTLDKPSYIRVSKNYYDGGEIEKNQEIINEIEIRYIVLPKEENIDLYPELEAFELEQLQEELLLDSLSSKMILGITGEEGKQMKEFIHQLKTLNKENNQKKGKS